MIKGCQESGLLLGVNCAAGGRLICLWRIIQNHHICGEELLCTKLCRRKHLQQLEEDLMQTSVAKYVKKNCNVLVVQV